MRILHSLTPPQYMERRSHGPHVDLWLNFLRSHGHGEGIELDNEFGETGEKRTKEFQLANGLEPDGGVGPKTRECAREKYDFDFNTACRSISGATTFVQPDGSGLNWSPNQPFPSA